MDDGCPATLVDFDLDRYLRNSRKVDLSGIEWDEIPNHPLSDGDVMCIHYMMDIETHTVVYLRDLLATRGAADPQITAFLSCWVYEELWHGEAFSDFLRAYGIEEPSPSGPGGPASPPRLRGQPCEAARIRTGARRSPAPTSCPPPPRSSAARRRRWPRA